MMMNLNTAFILEWNHQIKHLSVMVCEEESLLFHLWACTDIQPASSAWCCLVWPIVASMEQSTETLLGHFCFWWNHSHCLERAGWGLAATSHRTHAHWNQAVSREPGFVIVMTHAGAWWYTAILTHVSRHSPLWTHSWKHPISTDPPQPHSSNTLLSSQQV